MNQIGYAMVSGLAAVGAEIYFRSNAGEPWHVQWPAILLGLVVNWGIWGLLQRESVLGAMIFFTVATAGMRLLWTLVSGETVPLKVFIAFGLVVLASIIKSL